MTVDHLRENERLPVESGFLRYDSDWVWLLRDAGVIRLALVTCRAHDTIILLQLHAFGELPFGGMQRLLRAVRDECRERKIRAFLCWFSDRDTESVLEKGLEPYIIGRQQFNGEFVSGLI